MLDRLLMEAESRSLSPVVLSFWPHPRALFSGTPQPRIATFRDQCFFLRQQYPDIIWVVVPFLWEIARMSPDCFMEKILHERLQTDYVLVGDDFRFGRNRSGSIDDLRRQFSADEMPTQTHQGCRISSRWVKQTLRDGDFNLVKILLGRPYHISGRVVRGRQLGRQWGVPTANIRLGAWIPAFSGIFVVELSLDGQKRWPAVASLGLQPTLNSSQNYHLEVHLLDWSGDLYDKDVIVFFLHFLREEEKFSSLGALKRQIHQDVWQAKQYFGFLLN